MNEYMNYNGQIVYSKYSLQKSISQLLKVTNTIKVQLQRQFCYDQTLDYKYLEEEKLEKSEVNDIKQFQIPILFESLSILY